ncbi:MAG: S8 family serine peptidase, partial [Actinomycetota bacterium]
MSLRGKALRSLLLAFLVPVIVAAAGPGVSSSPAGDPPGGPASRQKMLPGDLGARMLPGELLVRFRPGVSRSQARSAHRAQGGQMAGRIGRFGVDLVRLRKGTAVQEGIAEYLADRRVELAEPNTLRFATETVPNDPRFVEQWGLRNTGQAHA